MISQVGETVLVEWDGENHHVLCEASVLRFYPQR